MRTYPIMLDVRGKTCLVVGAGEVGMRKVQTLLWAGAKVRLVAPQTPPDLPAEVEMIAAPYATEHVAGAALVFGCTDDRAVNARIAADARAAGALVNAADQPEDCDFYAAATITDGDVVVAIGTGGSAPGLAAHLRRTLQPHMPPRIGAFAQALDQFRQRLQAIEPDLARRGNVLKRLASQAGYERFLQQGPSGLDEMARE